MTFDRIADDSNGTGERVGTSKSALQKMLADAVARTAGIPIEKPDESGRRFTDKAPLDPSAVRSLPANYPALIENRTLFPSTVVSVDEDFSDRLLVSGKNNRKLGERVLKGKFKGYALYGLSLEERATCPTDCTVRAFCYGNGMQLARRHRITDLDLFSTFLEDEIRTILADPIDGLMIRLHVLGDFPSVEYVALWADLLDMHPKLACYGYTHRKVTEEIGSAISGMKERYPSRFRIRWSSEKPQPDGAVIINRIPDTKRVEEGLVCPAQTDATACCASCGLCWEGSAKKDTIVFIKHGPKSLQALGDSIVPEAKSQTATLNTATAAVSVTSENVRPVAAMKIPQKQDIILSAMPEVRMVSPTELKVEPAYQRDLSGKSINLIRKIVIGWDWAKFKPPVCAETEGGLFIIDGQHTAIAAASRPEIKQIPVMVVPAARVERRAEAFVSHNRDRLTMTPAQVFYGDVAAGNAEAKKTLDVVMRAGGIIPRLPVQKGYAKPGQITAISEVRRIVAGPGPALLERIIRIGVLSRMAPLTATIIAGLRILLTEKIFEKVAERPDTEIATALGSIKSIESASQHFAADTGQSRFRAAAGLIASEFEQREVA